MPLSPGKLRYELELMPLRIYGTRTHLFAEATMVDSMPRIDRPVFVCYHPEACFAHGLKNAVTVQHIERIRCMISSLGFNMTTPSASLVRLNRSRPPKEKKTREIRYQSQLTAKGEKGDDTIDTEQDSSFRWTRTNRYDDLEKLLSRYCKEVLTGTPADMDDIPEHLHHHLDYVYDIYMAAKAPAFASFRHTAALLRTLPPTDEMKWLTMCVGPDVVTLLRSPLADALVDSKNARLHPRLRHMLQRGCITVPSQKEMTTICARLRWAAKMYKIEQASSEKQMKEAITKARNSRTKLWARSIARTIVPTSEILNLDHPYNKSVDAAKFIKDLGENGWRGMGGYTNANPYRQVAGRIKAYNKYQDQDENVVRNGAGVVQSQKSYRLQDSPELHKWHEEILEEMKKADGDEMAFARYLKGFLIIPMHQRMIPAKYAGV